VPRHLFVTAAINPRNNPLTHPDRELADEPDSTWTVNGQQLDCRVFTVRTPGDSLAPGSNIEVTAHVNPSVPGAILRLDLRTRVDGEEVQFDARLVDFGGVR
jgi:hypothetical protein